MLESTISTTNKESAPVRVLAVENDPDMAFILKALFDDCGYVHLVLNEAIDMVDEVPKFCPDVVLLDFRLPLVNGGELCLQLKQNCQTEAIPVIIYSASSMSRLSGVNYKNDLFIEKPFKFEELTKSIERLTTHNA